MAHEPIRKLIRSLGEQERGALSDPELLDRFTSTRDEAAFELLVWRHGPMVLGVCRRLLGHTQDAEDALQITFLALVRKARSIRDGSVLATWLFQVAYRAALRLRAVRARRARREQAVDARALDAASQPVQYADACSALDEEIHRLPARQRSAFILCCLEGKTGEEAAHLLGCRPGTVSSRLTRARERLRGRLLRRGFVPAAALIAGLTQETLAESVRATTVGSVLANLSVPAQSIQLHMHGVLRAMLLNKLKNAAMLVAAIALLAAGGVFAHRAIQAQPPDAQNPVLPPAQVVQPNPAPRDGDDVAGGQKPQPQPATRTTRQRCGLTAYQRVDLHAAVGGFVKAVNVDIGDRVKKGQVLAAIDAPLLDLELRLAINAVQQGKGQLQECEASVAASRAEAQLARIVIQQREADLKLAEASVRFRQAQRERMRQLAKNKAIEEQLLDEAEERLSAAQAQMSAAQAAIATAKTEETVKQAKVRQAEAAVATAKGRVSAAEIALEKAQLLCNMTRVTAPFDGIVTSRIIQVGDLVRSADQGGPVPLLTVENTERLRAVVAIPEQEAPFAKVGDPVDLQVDALPNAEFKGLKISRAAYTIIAKTRTMRVEIDVPNPQQLLWPGMTATATILLDKGTATPPGPKGDAPPAIPKQAPAKPAAGTDAASAAQALEAARKVYQMDQTRMQNNEGVSMEEIYQWSRRWLEAQLELAEAKAQRVQAYGEHLGRMQDLEKRTKVLADAGQGRAADAAAGRYFRIEAERWLDQAKVK